MKLYTAACISISGNLLADADTLLGTATTDENGLADFDGRSPARRTLRQQRCPRLDDKQWPLDDLREVSVPDGYLIEQSVIPGGIHLRKPVYRVQVVDCLHSDKQTTVEIDKRAFISGSDDTFALPGATLTVTDWNGNVVDSWRAATQLM